MFGAKELAQINSRKAELIAQSNALRQELLEDWEKIQPTVSWVESGTSIIRRIKPLYAVAAPLLGIWAVSKMRSRSSLWGKLKVIWPIGRATATLWRNLNPHKT